MSREKRIGCENGQRNALGAPRQNCPPHDELLSLIAAMVESVVDSPGYVQVTTTTFGDEVTYHVRVKEGEYGQALGKEGKVAAAIRTIVKSSARRNGRTVFLSIEPS